MASLSLSYHSITRKVVVFSSLPTNTSSPISDPQPNTNTADWPKPPVLPTSKTSSTRTNKSTNTSSTSSIRVPRKKGMKDRIEQQLNLMHIERAIGAGGYRDHERPKKEGQLPNSDGFLEEGPLEKQLRETGEWVTKKTEGGFRSNGKRILMFSFQWAIPIYIFLVLVASGVINLPFSSSLVDDLIM